MLHIKKLTFVSNHPFSGGGWQSGTTLVTLCTVIVVRSRTTWTRPSLKWTATLYTLLGHLGI